MQPGDKADLHTSPLDTVYWKYFMVENVFKCMIFEFL